MGDQIKALKKKRDVYMNIESTILCYVYFNIENNSHGKKTRTEKMRSRASTYIRNR